MAEFKRDDVYSQVNEALSSRYWCNSKGIIDLPTVGRSSFICTPILVLRKSGSLARIDDRKVDVRFPN
jgi:hypothetical protein